MDRDLLTTHMHRAGQQWATCLAMGDHHEAQRLADEIDGYTRALDRLDEEDAAKAYWARLSNGCVDAMRARESIRRGLAQVERGETVQRDEWDALKGSPEHG